MYIMMNTKRLLKASSAWVSIVYAICYIGVAVFDGIRPGFMRYALHAQVDMGRNILGFGMFLSGLVIWNVIALIAVWLFATLWNAVKDD